MKWTRDRKQAIWYASLIIGAWVHAHREVLGMLALIGLALAADITVLWLAVQSARVGPL